jgi:hypothetical protein
LLCDVSVVFLADCYAWCAIRFEDESQRRGGHMYKT